MRHWYLTKALCCKHLLLTASHRTLSAKHLGLPSLFPASPPPPTPLHSPTSGTKPETRSVIQMLVIRSQASVRWKPGHREALGLFLPAHLGCRASGRQGSSLLCEDHPRPAHTRCPLPSRRISTGSLWSGPSLPSLEQNPGLEEMRNNRAGAGLGRG